MKHTDIIFNEWYGEISVAQQRAYKKYNVSQSDHDMLVERYGAHAHAEVARAVVTYSRSGMFDCFSMWSDRG